MDLRGMCIDFSFLSCLDRKDRMSMYHSLEVRVPFCDYRIAEYLYNVPWHYKDYKGYEKGLLRQAMQDYLPEQVLWRKKSPYPKTHHPDYLAAVSQMLAAILNDPDAPIFSLLSRERLQQLLTGTESVQWYGQLMTRPQTIAYFVQLNAWMQQYHVKAVLS
jgi:asparagine synthase (glutamine-hydrolysing)